MNRMEKWIGRLLRRPQKAGDDTDTLRTLFRTRYHSFKILLGANSRALEIMAEMEQALAGPDPFAMAFVRSRTTAVSVNVYRMVESLEQLSPEKYDLLRPRFSQIQKQIDALLTERPDDDPLAPLVIPLKDLDAATAHQAGTKMARLGEIRSRLNMDVPPGFVITAAACRRLLAHNDLPAEIDRRLQQADLQDMAALFTLSAELQQLILRAELPADLQSAMETAYAALAKAAGQEVFVALRSSALSEDSAKSSFAGQYRSVLNVSRDSLWQAYKEVVASQYSLPAITYRLNRGFREQDIAMCVGCMQMVDAAAGGVIYSRNPVGTDDDVHIHTVWGLPVAVVDGSTPGDLTVVSRKPCPTVAATFIRPKTHRIDCHPGEGVTRTELSAIKGCQPVLSADQALDLARLALRIEAHYDAPQDIEWAIDKTGRRFILQCRPLQWTPGPAIDAPADGHPGHETLLRGGVTASGGAAAGPVYPVTKRADMLRFPTGAVLVTTQALPDWAPLLARAAAIVTEQGGMAGHLASVAREFGLPALFDVPDALKRLAAGETVTVDAGGRAVYGGRVHALLEKQVAKRPPMAGSPVHDLLQQISRLVVPLNLLDPASPQFAPEHCRTLHDITRFVHEKSVHEMFSFGKTHGFSERSGKQLYHRVPMQWWILNLDDGFTEEVPGKYVHLDNIVSIPMRAFWDGFAAIAWDGPPPVDGRGLASVMFQSTANPSLVPGIRSRYASRNYFMISRHYCSLHSRLGYHFAIMEALVGDRPSENYVSFQFKGGAADVARRQRRVAFIGDLMENHGFRVEIREDNLLARAEGLDRPQMIRRLKTLGYLSLHTRQLDMIMSHGPTVDHYRRKMEKDLESLSLPE